MISILDLPDEIILKVIHYLEIKDLFRCGQSSKRIRKISCDESLWQKLNFSNSARAPNRFFVPTGLVKMALQNGCQYLSLEDAMLGSFSGRKIASKGKMCLNKVSKLRYLDLKNCFDNDGCFEEILSSCNCLQKLSMACCFLFQPLSQNMIKSICFQNGETLQTLDLRGCEGLLVSSIKKITKYCQNLKNVDFCDTSLSERSIKFLVKNLTSKVEKLNLGHLKNITDDHVKTLVKRCDKLSVLILENTLITDNSLTHIIENLQNKLEKLDVLGCNKLTISKKAELKDMPRLKALNCLDKIDFIYNEKYLKKKMPNVRFDEEISAKERTLSSNEGIWDIKVKQVLYRRYE